MKNLIIILLLILPGISFAQQVRSESEYYSLKNKLFEAKYTNNSAEQTMILKELTSKYPEHVSRSEDASEIVKAGIPAKNSGISNTPDFGPSDINIYQRELSTGQTTSTEKFIDLESDSNGVQYISYVCPTFDTLHISSSSNGGMNWTEITYVYLPFGLAYQSVDMFITDSANTFRIGLAVTYNGFFGVNIGNLVWMSMKTDGTGFRSAFIRQRDLNFGWKNSSIVSDGFDYSAGSTYWYAGYVRNDSATGNINTIQASVSPDWGYTWIHDTVSSGVEMRNIRINYNHYNIGNDSIYISFEQNVIFPFLNKSITISRINLIDFGGSTPWTSLVLGTSADEIEGEIAVNRVNKQIAYIYTQINAGTGKDIRYKYFIPGGTYFAQGPDIEVIPGTQNRPRINCIPQEDKWRIAYCSSGSVFDTVIYKETTNIITGFSGRTAVNPGNLSEAVCFPALTGFKTGVNSFAGGIAFIKNTVKNLWYDGTNIIPTVIHNGNTIVKNFDLSQNYPNPFNPVTKIIYTIPFKNFVTLKIFDITGKEVRKLINNIVEAGHYSLNINASDLSSGIYFYKLTAGENVSVKKMSLIK